MVILFMPAPIQVDGHFITLQFIAVNLANKLSVVSSYKNSYLLWPQLFLRQNILNHIF
jgi:hypothetical protein